MNKPLIHIVLLQLDAQTKEREVWYSDGVIGEPCFVPRSGYDSNNHGEEDDGWLLVQLYHPDLHRTDFCILDSQRVGEGPVARIRLKHHVPYGFHGTFTPEVFLQNDAPVVCKSKL